MFRNVCYPDVFKTVEYLEPWHIQNQKYIQSPSIFTSLLYSEPAIFRTLSQVYDEVFILFMAKIIFTDYSYFCKACHVEINVLNY